LVDKQEIVINGNQNWCQTKFEKLALSYVLGTYGLKEKVTVMIFFNWRNLLLFFVVVFCCCFFFVLNHL